MNENRMQKDPSAERLGHARFDAGNSATKERPPVDELWNEESESFLAQEPIVRAARARLPVSAHNRRGRPSQETRASMRARHRISRQGGMHHRRRKSIR